jgi:hypothetical protein
MIEIKKPNGSNIATIYKKSGSLSGSIQNINTHPITLIDYSVGNAIVLISWYFSFGDDVTGSPDNNFYLINYPTIYPLSLSNINGALVCFNVVGAPVQIVGGAYSGINTRPTYFNGGVGSLALTQLTDSTSFWQFIKYTIFYTLIPSSDL